MTNARSVTPLLFIQLFARPSALLARGASMQSLHALSVAKPCVLARPSRSLTCTRCRARYFKLPFRARRGRRLRYRDRELVLCARVRTRRASGLIERRRTWSCGSINPSELFRARCANCRRAPELRSTCAFGMLDGRVKSRAAIRTSISFWGPH